MVRTGQVRGPFHQLRPPHGQVEQGGWESMAGKELQNETIFVGIQTLRRLPLGNSMQSYPILELPFDLLLYLFF